MIRIAIICLIIFFVKSNYCSLSHEDLENLINVFSDSETFIKNRVLNEDAAIFVGKLKSGKSTLINYLIGNTLKSIKMNRFDQIRIVKADNQTDGPTIGSLVSAETTIPSKWTSKVFPDLSLWDCPGFDDNRGAVQDITNAFYVYHLMKNVKSLKIILVIETDSLISDNIDDFLSTLRSFQQMFIKQFDVCFQSISIIFSKAEYKFYGSTINHEFIKGLLNEKVLLAFHNIISPFTEGFIQYIIDNKDNVAFFKKARRKEILFNINNSSDIDDNIVSAIRNSRSLNRSSLLNVRPIISTSSEAKLLDAKSDLQSVQKIASLSETTVNVCIKIINDMENSLAAANEENLNTIKENVTAIIHIIDSALNDSSSLQERIRIFQQLNHDIVTAIKKDELWIKINQLEFIDRILNIEMGPQMNFGFKAILDAAKSKMEIINNEIDLHKKLIAEKEYRRRKQEIENNRNQTQNAIKISMEKISVRDKIINFWNKIKKFILRLV
ncbi:uncharacterized protein LOC122510636 [Leptopilina heterotoma]|uniref:uncharacterized protein LOC122510636 n=1 Tax=Leptopilina heterotoma TaxID=63436 RepID=UPI001CAA2498|nr:uncharacterized protein LOC122510636 [Leptopilina heterotoma]